MCKGKWKSMERINVGVYNVVVAGRRFMQRWCGLIDGAWLVFILSRVSIYCDLPKFACRPRAAQVPGQRNVRVGNL
jgi:hypothetical protein